METFQQKVDAAKAKIELKKGEEKRDRNGKFRKETWREKFGFWRIMWIVIWAVALGASYTYVIVKAPELFAAKVIVIPINHANAQTAEEPIGEATKVISEKSGTFYTYNAEESQTDGNPYRTASGRIVKDGIVANNCLPFGTKVDVEGSEFWKSRIG
jgi:hypothetical protein